MKTENKEELSTTRLPLTLKFQQAPQQAVIEQVLERAVPVEATDEQVAAVRRGLTDPAAPTGILPAAGGVANAGVMDMEALVIWAVTKRCRMFGNAIPTTANARTAAWDGYNDVTRGKLEEEYNREKANRTKLSRTMVQALLQCLPDGQPWTDVIKGKQVYKDEVLGRGNFVLLRQLIAAELSALTGGTEASQLLQGLRECKQGSQEALTWLTKLKILVQELGTHWNLAPGQPAYTIVKEAVVLNANSKDGSTTALGLIAQALSEVQNGHQLTLPECLDRLERAYRNIQQLNAGTGVKPDSGARRGRTAHAAHAVSTDKDDADDAGSRGRSTERKHPAPGMRDRSATRSRSPHGKSVGSAPATRSRSPHDSRTAPSARGQRDDRSSGAAGGGGGRGWRDREPDQRQWRPDSGRRDYGGRGGSTYGYGGRGRDPEPRYDSTDRTYYNTQYNRGHGRGMPLESPTAPRPRTQFQQAWVCTDCRQVDSDCSCKQHGSDEDHRHHGQRRAYAVTVDTDEGSADEFIAAAFDRLSTTHSRHAYVTDTGVQDDIDDDHIIIDSGADTTLLRRVDQPHLDMAVVGRGGPTLTGVHGNRRQSRTTKGPYPRARRDRPGGDPAANESGDPRQRWPDR